MKFVDVSPHHDDDESLSVTNSINSAVSNVPYQITTSNGQSTSNSFLAVQGDGWVNVEPQVDDDQRIEVPGIFA